MYCSHVTRISEGTVREPHSQIAMLTRVLREREKEMEEFQHKLLDQTMSEVHVYMYRFVFLSLGS